MRVGEAGGDRHQTPCGDIADHAAQVFLDIPFQVAQDETERLGEIGGTCDVRIAHHRLAALRQGQRGAGGQDDLDGGFALPKRLDRAVRCDAEIDGQWPQYQAGALAGERGEPLTRPRCGSEQAVERQQYGQIEHVVETKRGPAGPRFA